MLERLLADPGVKRVRAGTHRTIDLARPTLFLVHGPGRRVERRAADLRASRAPDVADRGGVIAQDYSFADDMRVWSYDKGDFSMRLEVDTGPFDEILLEAELAAAEDMAH